MLPSRSTTRDLRRINRQTILQHLYFAGPITRLELSQSSGLSPATITNVVSELLLEGVVIESGMEESQGGRPRTILAINPAYGFFIGVDLGETHIQIVLLDLAFQPLGGLHQPLAARAIGMIVDQIVAGVQILLQRAAVGSEAVIGVGIGVPGVVQRSDLVTVSAAGWGWQDVPLAALLADRLAIPIYVDNGAKAMAQAEMWFGAGRGGEDLAVLLIGTGVGAGIITQGNLYRGTTNSAGEWGHTVIEINGRPCRCGSHGCLEAYIGATQIIDRLRDRAPESLLLEHDDQVGAIPAIIAAARGGDTMAAQVVGETIHYLGAGIANLLNLFNPKVVVIGGWVGLQLGAHFLSQIQAIAMRYALRQPFSIATITLSQLGQDEIALGAASLVLEGFFRSDQALLRTPDANRMVLPVESGGS
jgi:predicted NBD/HSP70 family sugar kinase